MTFDEDIRRPFTVQIVVYPERTVRRYGFEEQPIEERYRRPVLTRRRRKKLAARQRRPYL